MWTPPPARRLGTPLLDGADQIVAPGLHGADLVDAGLHQLRVQGLVELAIGLGQVPLGLQQLGLQG